MRECVCVTVLKRDFKYLSSYSKYMKFSSGYRPIIININISNPEPFKIFKFVREK